MKSMRIKRSPYSFANINLIGPCNCDCYFCLGTDLNPELCGRDDLDVHYSKWPNFTKYLSHCHDLGIEQLYLTGINTDPLLYAYLKDLIEYLKQQGFYVGMRTNGIIAGLMMEEINSCTTCKGDAVGYSFISRQPNIAKSITRSLIVPDWVNIWEETKVPYRISIVITRHNYHETIENIYWIAKNASPQYIQLRRVVTNHPKRKSLLKGDQRVFDYISTVFKQDYKLVGEYENAEIFRVAGLDVVLWRTVATTANSINYFTDGTMTDDYFIVKGYWNAQHKQEG